MPRTSGTLIGAGPFETSSVIGSLRMAVPLFGDCEMTEPDGTVEL